MHLIKNPNINYSVSKKLHSWRTKAIMVSDWMTINKRGVEEASEHFYLKPETITRMMSYTLNNKKRW